MKRIYQVKSYAIVVESGTITDFEIVEKSGGLVPKVGQEFNAYLFKSRMTWADIKDLTQIKIEAKKDELNTHVHPMMQPFVNAIHYGGCL